MLAADQNLIVAELRLALESGEPDAVKRIADTLDRDGKDPVALVTTIASSDEATSEARQIALRSLEILDRAAFLRIQEKEGWSESIDLIPGDANQSENPTKWVIAGLVVLAVLWPAHSIYRFNNPKPSKAAESPSHSRSSAPSRSDVGSGKKRISGDHRFGCSGKEYFEKVVGYAAQGDKEAFSRALSTGVALGICTMFDSRESVFITDTAIFAGLVEIRREGDTQEFWTNIEAID